MYGKYKHTLDAKGRLFVPAKLREELGDAFYIATSADACLRLYPEAEWKRVLERCEQLPGADVRKLRGFFASVNKIEPDKQGRFLLPESYRKYAGIEQDVYFLGQANVAEIWAADRYEAEEAKYMTPENIAAVMDALGL